ncbi:MAG: hypothetical protein CMJ68_00080 [Planctomycetaceae bacterium]|nr:hypothetical protein [Planctomycetaceae bacterium]
MCPLQATAWRIGGLVTNLHRGRQSPARVVWPTVKIKTGVSDGRWEKRDARRDPGANIMLRSIFLSAGVFVVLVGASLFQVDRVVLNGEGEIEEDLFGLVTADESGRHVIQPPDWAPFSLVAIGGVTCLYAFAVPTRRRDG